VLALDSARRSHLQGRMFNELRWGGNILLSWPEQRIFIDGMTDFLGNEVLSSYIRIVRLDAGWEAELDRHGISIVIMPPTSRLVHELRKMPDWQVWYADDVATILTRETADRPRVPNASGMSARPMKDPSFAQTMHTERAPAGLSISSPGA
jgi:hypothetical protein